MKPEKALATAAARGDLDTMRGMITEDRPLASHWQPIMDPCYVGQADAVALLLENGADPNIKSKSAHHYRALPFGMRILAIDIRDVGADEVREFGVEFAGKPADLDKVIAESDVVSLHLHLNDKTRHTIDALRLRLMKPTAFLINVARGALVDEAALEEALVEGRIGGAGLDAFGREPPDVTSPIFSLPNVIATPHTSGTTDGTSRRRAQASAENVDRIAAGLEPLYRVD